MSICLSHRLRKKFPGVAKLPEITLKQLGFYSLYGLYLIKDDLLPFHGQL